MQSHIMIKAGGAPLSLPSDFSLDVELKNPMFNDVETFSYPVQIPLTGNRHLLKNMDSRHSAMRPVSVEHEASEIYAEGFQLFKGEIATSVDEELSDSLSFNIEGNKTLKSLIQDLDCKDIRVKDDICIGEKITKVTVRSKGKLKAEIYQNGVDYFFDCGEITGVSEFAPQALGFSIPKRTLSPLDNATIAKEEPTDVDGYVQNIPDCSQSYINVSDPYPTAKYCNARVAYKHYAIAADGSTDTSNIAGNPYMVLDADRPQSGICFYVLYFLDCLFDYLGLEWDNSELLKIEDMKRLCFYTTKCKFVEEDYGVFESSSFDKINSWLSSRGCGAQFDISDVEKKPVNSITVPKNATFITEPRGVTGYLKEQTTFSPNLDQDASFPIHRRYTVENPSESNLPAESVVEEDVTVSMRITDVVSEWNDFEVTRVIAYVGYMYATSENFPDTTVTTIIESLENQFGIRFIYDAEGKKVTARLLRDIYRTTAPPHRFLGTVDSMTKIAEKITGVRIGYSDEQNSKEQSNNLRDNVRDYDTAYDYKDYPDPDDKVGMAGTVKARTTDISHQYADFSAKVSNTDNTCYIDQTTGNAYRIKVSSETNLEPCWFEVGQWKGVEFGDCSADNDDFITELKSDFQPLPLNIVNPSTAENTHNPLLVAFCDEDMEHEYVKQYLEFPFDVAYGSVSVRAELRIKEAYDTSSSDDGNSPLQTYDWGNAIAIMRGGGTDASTQLYDSGYDGFANSKWRQVAGKYALTTDSIDPYGNQYDYNGTADGLLAGERFSLKPRAYKGWLCPWATSALCNADQLNDGDASNDNQPWYYYIRNRGWVDRFLFEHAHFLLERRKFKVLVHCSAAVLMDIKNHWADRWLIDGEVGYIDKVSASLSAATGIDQVEITFYAI